VLGPAPPYGASGPGAVRLTLGGVSGAALVSGAPFFQRNCSATMFIEIIRPPFRRKFKVGQAYVGTCPRGVGVAYVILMLGCILLVSTGVLLEPDPRGYGTHEQLGLPPCPLPKLVGYPCPACGVTTALARMARFQAVASVLASPFGAVIFVAACGILCYATIEAAIGQWWRPARILLSRYWWGASLLVYFLSWIFKIALVATGLQRMG